MVIVYSVVMWRWDQGHLPYFQFDTVRKMASLVCSRDFKQCTHEELLAATGLAFKAPRTHSPWRQYSRVLRLTLLTSEDEGRAAPTELAKALATPGAVTCDEYLHFLVQTFTDPSPAFELWTPNSDFRFPLLFALKYLLAKQAVSYPAGATPVDEVIGAYLASNFRGDEEQPEFIGLLRNADTFKAETQGIDVRQPRESLQVIAQISYIHLTQSGLSLSLDPSDASEIFNALNPVLGARADDRDREITRLAHLFRDGSTQNFFAYANTVVSEVVESGFSEGSKVKRTHIVIERNRRLRESFFASLPNAVCDVCSLDTARTYPWTTGVLDLHHLLPLASGTRVVSAHLRQLACTTLSDLVPVCPTCHRAIHRFYDRWLSGRRQADFADREQARDVYKLVKTAYGGATYVQREPAFS
jgi:hypothetical protein